MSVHLDMVMLALMQAAAAAGIYALPGRHPARDEWLAQRHAVRLAPGGGERVRSGRRRGQRLAASSSFLGTAALTTGWVLLLSGWIGA